MMLEHRSKMPAPAIEKITLRTITAFTAEGLDQVANHLLAEGWRMEADLTMVVLPPAEGRCAAVQYARSMVYYGEPPAELP